MSNNRNRNPTPRRHPLLIGREPGVWYPDLVGKIPGYAKTEAGYKRRQEAARRQATTINETGRRGNRKGVPDGFAGRRAEVEEIKAAVKATAEEVAAKLAEQGVIEPTQPAEAPKETRKQKRERQLAEVLAIVLDPTATTAARIKAAGMALEKTMKRPKQRKEVTVIFADSRLNQSA